MVATMENSIGSFPVGLEGVYLTRSSARGPLGEIVGAARQTLEMEPTPLALDWQFPRGDLAYREPNTTPELEFIDVPTAAEIPGRPGYYQVWFDSLGGLDLLEGREQIYVLIDSGDLADELDETNNLMCLNCLAPGQTPETAGVIVRLPFGVPVGELFPEAYGAAASKLPSLNPRFFDPRVIRQPRLNARIEPEFGALPLGSP
jgi:hypothetical protein